MIILLIFLLGIFLVNLCGEMLNSIVVLLLGIVLLIFNLFINILLVLIFISLIINCKFLLLKFLLINLLVYLFVVMFVLLVLLLLFYYNSYGLEMVSKDKKFFYVLLLVLFFINQLQWVKLFCLGFLFVNVVVLFGMLVVGVLYILIGQVDLINLIIFKL